MGKVATHVNITKGNYRNTEINGIFPLITPYKITDKSAFVTVAYTAEFPKARIKVTPENFTYVTADGAAANLRVSDYCDTVSFDEEVSDAEKEYRDEETESEAMDRIARQFEILVDMTDAAQRGDVRAFIISGPPGIGKSFGVEEALRRNEMLNKIAGGKEKYNIVKGAARALALYKQLYLFRHSDNVLVFDDCDTILFDEESLNLLKSALDTTRRRQVSWLAESNVLKDEGIDNTFNFNGSVIFLTNLDFDNIKSKKLAPHLAALKSRCLYMDLEISSTEDMLLRIKQVMRDGLLTDYNFSSEVEQEIYDFVEANVDDLQELSLRTLLKIAQFRRVDESTWQEYAVNMVMHRAARFRWLAAQKKKRLEAEYIEAWDEAHAISGGA